MSARVGGSHEPRRLAAISAGIVLVSLMVVVPAAHAVTSCGASGVHTICVTVNGAPLVGESSITVTNSPNSGTMIYTWIPAGRSAITLMTAFAKSPSTNDYSFIWPTHKYRDGSGVLSVRIGGASTPVEAPVSLSNGNATDFQHSPSDFASFLPTTWTGQSDPVIAAVGDGASNEVRSNAVAASIVSSRPALFLYLGDIYEEGTFTENRNHYGRSAMDVAGAGGGTLWGQLAEITHPTVGSHENLNLSAWRDYFHGYPEKLSFIFGGVLFINVNSQKSFQPGSAQYTFVQNALAAAPACVVGFWHTPALKGGTVNQKRLPMWSLLANNGGDLVVNADAHSMAEYEPLDANLNPGPNAHMVELISGAGGRSPGTALADAAGRINWSEGKTQGVVYLTLNGAAKRGTATSISWSFRTVGGPVVRTGSVSCRT
ncbi:MAG TPA: hypothetical protein VF351_09040 [Actinomycetota bacterium]